MLEIEQSSQQQQGRSDSDDAQMQQVIEGLQSDPPQISPRWFYDDVGSALFETITRVPEYYPTRCEIEILKQYSGDIASALPSGLAVVELGSGSARKVGQLLPELSEPRSYHPVDVSRAALDATATEIAAILPDLVVDGLCTDFTHPQKLGALLSDIVDDGPVLLFFPGSTIGNFDDDEAANLLTRLHRWLPVGTPFVLGVDLVKDPDILETAYNDPIGVTAAFNRNLLAHLNRQFGADFNPEQWRHEAVWVPDHHRVEMWLRSCGDQTVHFGDTTLTFQDGDGIHTESCHKWDRPRLQTLAETSGWSLQQSWTDSQRWFAEVLLVRSDGSHRAKAFAPTTKTR